MSDNKPEHCPLPRKAVSFEEFRQVVTEKADLAGIEWSLEPPERVVNRERRSVEALSAATISEIHVAAKKIAARILELRALRKGKAS